MSEFTHTAEVRISKLTNYMLGLIAGENGVELVKKYDIIVDNFIPSDILKTFDNVFAKEKDIEKIKTASNKLFNILYKAFNEFPEFELKKDRFLYLVKKDNELISKLLDETKPYIKELNTKGLSEELKKQLVSNFEKLLLIDNHYVIKENILFPVLEKEWEHTDCLKLMWSFHDDIRKNIKRTIEILQDNNFDLKLFNKVSSLVFFNIKTIIFREEKVLFPIILQTIEETILNNMLQESLQMSFAFVDTSHIERTQETSDYEYKNKLINLETGTVSVKELEQIFNHLPVDITFVDDKDTVKYFSTPKHRIFPRTKAIIGRKVHDCHPPESVDVVEKIVDAFRSGKKDKAAFWIKMGPMFVLIQYFAVRDEQGKFMGTLEVSQEVSEIRSLEGERRLLDWED